MRDFKRNECKHFRGSRCELEGVYAITCLANGKIYVGSSVRLAHRIYGHFKQLRDGVHHSKKLQACFNKYGEAHLSVSILEYIPIKKRGHREYLIEREQFFIDKFNAFEKGLNSAPKASSTLGIKKTEEQKLAIGERGSKNYRVISPSGEIFEVIGLSAFCRTNGLNSAALSRVALGKALHHKGWRAEFQSASPFPIEHWQGLDFEAIANAQQRPARRMYRFISQMGEVVEGDSITEFCKLRGLNPKNLGATASHKGTQNWHKGWRCEWLDNPRNLNETIYVITTPEGQQIEVFNVAKFARQHNLNHAALHKVAKGHGEHHHGYKMHIKGEQPPVFIPIQKNQRRWWRAISPGGVAYEFQNLKRFCLEHDLTGPLMHNVARGKMSQHKGWRCSMVDPPEQHAAD